MRGRRRGLGAAEDDDRPVQASGRFGDARRGLVGVVPAGGFDEDQNAGRRALGHDGRPGHRVGRGQAGRRDAGTVVDGHRDRGAGGFGEPVGAPDPGVETVHQKGQQHPEDESEQSAPGDIEKRHRHHRPHGHRGRLRDRERARQQVLLDAERLTLVVNVRVLGLEDVQPGLVRVDRSRQGRLGVGAGADLKPQQCVLLRPDQPVQPDQLAVQVLAPGGEAVVRLLAVERDRLAGDLVGQPGRLVRPGRGRGHGQQVAALDDLHRDLAREPLDVRARQSLVRSDRQHHGAAGELGHEVLAQELVVLKVDVEVTVAGEPGVEQQLGAGRVDRRLRHGGGDAGGGAQGGQRGDQPAPLADCPQGPVEGRHRSTAAMSASTTGMVRARILRSFQADRLTT